jgi:mannose-6-phosphate isomerase-like protein (cupin superfamily)
VSIRRIRLENASELDDLFSVLEGTVIVENFTEICDFGSKMINSIDALKSIHCQDMVGYVAPGGAAEGLPFHEAIDKIDHSGGYINGWEYAAGTAGLTINTACIDRIVNGNSFAVSRLGLGGRMLDSVMKWIFISRGPQTGSEWHVDPIGSAAWMVCVTGSKLWTVRSDVERSGVVHPGELILVPPGIAHRVENIGESLNVAVTHNWIPSNKLDCMWNCLAGIDTNLAEGDHLVMGLVIALSQLPKNDQCSVIPGHMQTSLLPILDSIARQIGE